MAIAGHGPASIAARVRQPLWSRIDEAGQRLEGVVNFLLEARLIGEEWRAKSRAAVAGESADEV